MKIFIIISFMILTSNVQATPQRPDLIIYENKTLPLHTYPLETYFHNQKSKPKDISGFSCTAAWRGYIATWEIKKNYLYLVKIVKGNCKTNAPEISLSVIFPEQPLSVRADWFSGTLRIIDGELLPPTTANHQDIFEMEILLSVKNGKVVYKSILDNSINQENKFRKDPERFIEWDNPPRKRN